MTSSQPTLFGSTPAAKKTKAKALPLTTPAPVVPLRQLTPAQKSEATKARNRLRSGRDAWKIGDCREAESECPACDGPQLAVLEERNAEGGQTWGAYCVNVKCERCPDHGLVKP